MAAPLYKTQYRCVFRFPRLLCRYFSNTSPRNEDASPQYCPLERRGLLRVGGTDSVKLLHGLVTNNVELFHQDVSLKSMFAMFLNAQGRVLYDVIFYKDTNHTGSPTFLIECDNNATSALLKHLKMYKLRSKVDISHVQDILPWTVFSSDEVNLKKTNSDTIFNIVTDPRIKVLGARLLLPEGVGPPDCLEGVVKAQGGAYEEHRAKLGVCEGTDEIQTGDAMPLEYNLAYLYGVSYQKGCYVGQELTARTHHTGVIRKRIMPFTVTSPNGAEKLTPGTAIKTEGGKASGKTCIMHGNYGLAMIRLANLKAGKLLTTDAEGNSIEINPYVPKWWPKDEHIM